MEVDLRGKNFESFDDFRELVGLADTAIVTRLQQDRIYDLLREADVPPDAWRVHGVELQVCPLEGTYLA